MSSDKKQDQSLSLSSHESPREKDNSSSKKSSTAKPVTPEATTPPPPSRSPPLPPARQSESPSSSSSAAKPPAAVWPPRAAVSAHHTTSTSENDSLPATEAAVGSYVASLTKGGSQQASPRSNELPPVHSSPKQQQEPKQQEQQSRSDAVVTPPPLRPLSGGMSKNGHGSFVQRIANEGAAAAAASSSSPSKPNNHPGSAGTKRQTAEQIMEGRNMQAILQEFVRDCYRETPVDVVAFMAEWALKRRPPRPPSSPPHRPTSASSQPNIGITAASPHLPPNNAYANAAAAAAGSPGAAALSTPARPSTHGSQRSSSTGGIMSLNLERPPSSGNIISRRLLCIVLGAEKSNKEQLLAMLDTLAPSEEEGGGVGTRMGPALKDLLGSARDKVKAAGLDTVALVPCESDRMGGCIVFADLPSNELTKNLVTLTAMADLACIVVSARYGVADMVTQRQGELYMRLLLAHSVGVKHAFVVLTDMRGVAPPVVENVEKEVRLMAQRCGFDANQLQIVRGTNSSDVLFDSIAKVQIQRRIPFTLKPVTRMKATMIVLYGTGIKSGDRLAVYSHGHFEVRVAGIPTLIDRKTHEVTDHNLGVLKRNQVATLELTVLNNARPQTSISANILAYSGGRVVAMGNVAEMFLDEQVDDEEEEEEEEEEEFALSAGSPAQIAAAREKQQRLMDQAAKNKKNDTKH